MDENGTELMKDNFDSEWPSLLSLPAIHKENMGPEYLKDALLGTVPCLQNSQPFLTQTYYVSSVGDARETLAVTKVVRH